MIDKGPLDSMVTKDKGKATITAIEYSAPDRTMLFNFYNHPNYFGYGLMGQVSVLENSILHVDEG